MRYRLKEEYIELIRYDAILWGRVADVMNIGAPSLKYQLDRNTEKLTQKKVLKLLSKCLNVPEDDLVEEIAEPQTAA
jgi:hypothetical protein